MKQLKNMLMLGILLSAMQVGAQTDKATTARLVEEQRLVFNATSAMPLASADVTAVLNKMQGAQGAGNIQLSGGQYDLRLTKDSVTAFLPYYGRAYVANMNTNESGIRFNSKKFNYKSDKKKKGGWVITITPKDTRDVQSMTLSVSENGYGMLNVNSNNRQSITFNGYISEPKALSK
ncbi:hypothetical protein PBAL39_09751 [Pedobacter sp. BAL39]|uniref:DUF4251 domain-containing protein n=1 Tax=Pedobacter sp. BAL39 TaxID=391596 RepID=UPI0001559FEC|nr:DUF4251 domain-containing protein [Pedobacter sp. BAL39]EDM37418.1 hypothetical protein PBAL39_09751 [Pedobacter sp. BAL39]